MDENSVLCQARGSELQYLKQFHLLEIIFTSVNCAYSDFMDSVVNRQSRA